MLEFLVEIDNQLYNRGRIIENIIQYDQVLVEIQAFFHIGLKKIYKLTYQKYNFNIRKVRGPKKIELTPTLGQFLHNPEFCFYLKNELLFNEIDTLDELNSIINGHKHDIVENEKLLDDNIQYYSDDKKELFFKCLFDFASSYYKFKTGKFPKQKWNDKDFSGLKEKDNKLISIKGSNTSEIINSTFNDYSDTFTRFKTLEEKINRYAPLCPTCHEKMQVAKNSNNGSLFFRCHNSSKSNRHQTINGTTIDPILGQEYAELYDICHKSKYSNEYFTNKYKTEKIAYFNGSLDQKQRYMFQSLGLPYSLGEGLLDKSLYDEFKEFSRFSVLTNIISKPISKEKQFIFNMALRIFTRGIVTTEPDYIENELTKMFEQGKCHTNILFDYINYNNPFFLTDSIREGNFLNNNFRNIFGKSWASYVLTQCPFEMFNTKRYNQRIDFLVCKQGIPFAIELDGDEHSLHTTYDKGRNLDLLNCGIQTIRISNKDVDNSNIIIKEFDIYNKVKKYKELNISKRVLVGIKIIHQIEIAVTKMLLEGHLDKDSNLSIKISTNIFNKTESNYLLYIALKQIELVIAKLGKIYDIDIKPKFNNKNLNETVIYIGDGDFSVQSILIRDISLPLDYKSKIDRFSPNFMPKIIDRNCITFFLKYIFGFDDFREGQFESIQQIMLKKDTIVLLPTGSGKSIIYQLASFLVPGLIVVVSPLRALIKDQVDNLHVRGIDSVHSLYYEESDKNTQNMFTKEIEDFKSFNNNISLLYLSPERLIIERFRIQVNSFLLNTFVYSVAIDEAHCISEWGHEFRVSYLGVGDFSRKIFKCGCFIPSIIALTGTASDAVVKDIKRILKINDKDSVFRPKNFNREELSFSLKECDCNNKLIVLKTLIKQELPNYFNVSPKEFYELNGNNTYSGIVFAPYVNSNYNSFNRNYTTMNIYSYLMRNLGGYGVAPYSTTGPKDITNETWNGIISESSAGFKRNDINLLIATKAFGMGIDKGNIRYVIHNGIPLSLEQYYQEAGRAGRDKRTAKCIILFSLNKSSIDKDIFNPSKTLQDIKEINSQLKSTQYDDLAAMLYFHLNAFPGVEEELKNVKIFLNNIDFCNNFVENNTHRFSTDKIKFENCKDEQKDAQKIIYRLLTLGIVQEYTLNNGKHEFNITFGSLKQNDIIDHYEEYVRNYNIGRLDIEIEKMKSINMDKGNESILDCVELLTKFIYENIEIGRRRAMQSMYEMAVKASQIEDGTQDEFIREEIVNYFNVENANVINNVIDDKQAGLKFIEKIFKFNKDSKYTEESLNKAKALRGESSRVLESYPDHPGLLLIKTVSDILSNNYKKDFVINDILSAYEFSIQKYNVKSKEMINLLSKIFNLVNSKSNELFIDLKNQFKHKYNETYIELREDMISSENISDNLRDLILIDYCSDKLNEYTGGIV